MKTINELLKDCKSAVDFMRQEITYICRDMKKRPPGSEGEREAAIYMADLLKRDCDCTDIKVESFKVHPGSFYSYFYFSSILDTLCAAGFFLSPWISLIFGSMALLLFLTHFVLYKKPLDVLFPERESVNVTGVKTCKAEIKQRIFLNGHLDAAWEFPLNYHFGGIVFEIPGILSTIGVLFYIALSIFALIGTGTWLHTAALCGLIFIPFFLLLMITFNPRRVVDGANDNLSGCYIGIAILREMKRLNITLQNTELGVILTGSEEAGTRGAKAWSEVHKDDYQDVPTYILCFDTIHDPMHLAVNIRDLNETVKADPELCSLFLQAAEKAGVPCRKDVVPLFGGSTDSAAFTQGGFRSVGITGLNHVLEDYYHTRRDSCDNLNEEGLKNCYQAAVTFLAAMENK